MMRLLHDMALVQQKRKLFKLLFLSLLIAPELSAQFAAEFAPGFAVPWGPRVPIVVQSISKFRMIDTLGVHTRITGGATINFRLEYEFRNHANVGLSYSNAQQTTVARQNIMPLAGDSVARELHSVLFNASNRIGLDFGYTFLIPKWKWTLSGNFGCTLDPEMEVSCSEDTNRTNHPYYTVMHQSVTEYYGGGVAWYCSLSLNTQCILSDQFSIFARIEGRMQNWYPEYWELKNHKIGYSQQVLYPEKHETELIVPMFACTFQLGVHYTIPGKLFERSI